MKESKKFQLWDAESNKKVMVKATHLNGDEWQAVCPKHDDHHPSLNINDRKKVYYCHGCQFKGSLYRHGLKGMKKISPKSLLSVELISKSLRIYLKKNRKWTPDAFKHFGVGEGSYHGKPCLIIPAEDFQKVYLYKQKENRWRAYPRGSGVLRGDLSGNTIIIAEGEWDFFCLWEKGFKNVVTSTTGVGNFADDKLHLLKGKDVVLAYDNQGDVTNRAIERMQEKLRGIASSIRIIDWTSTQLKDKEDVRDFFTKYKGKKKVFLKLIENAKTPIELEIEGVDSSLRGLKLNRQLKPIIKKLATISASERDAHLNLIKSRFDLSIDDIKGFKQEIKSIAKEIKGSQEQILEPIPTAMFPGLVDIVEYEGAPAFLVVKNGELKVKTQYEIDGVIYEPPPRENMKWLLPRAEEVMKYYKDDNVHDLYYDLVAYHKSISELPSENYYHLLALWDFHTYLYEYFRYSPYIWFFATWERGKTRTGEGCTYVAWRGLVIQCLREATLLRYAQDAKATLFFDVMDIWRKAERNGSEDILLKRFEKGATVSRVQYPERGPHKDIKHYEIYGPTIIATNEPVSELLATRAIQVVMPESDKRFENDIEPEHGLPYKERLTAFRAKYMCENLPDAEKPTRGRLGDILRPLRQIVKLVCPQEEQKLIAIIKEIELERGESLRETIEARIMETLFLMKNDAVEGGKLKASLLKDRLNEGLPERFQQKQSYYTRKVKSLGLKTKRPGGDTYIIWNDVVCNKLAQRYLPKDAQSAQIAQHLEKTRESKCTKQSIHRIKRISKVHKKKHR